MANEFDDLNKEIAELTALQQGLGIKAEDQEKGIKAFTEATIKGTGQLAKGLGSWSKSVGEGDTSFSSLSSVIDIATNALANMAKTIPIAGQGLSQTAKAAGEAGKFMLGQLDATTKAFNQMGQVSALGAKGMSGLKDQFTGARLPLETLGKIVTENAATFARWKDTTAEGTDAFSEIVGQLTDKSDLSLRRLGMSAEQIGTTTAAFISQQTRLGIAQRSTNAELVEGTKKYAEDLDQLQKLTGQSAKNIQDQQARMLSQAKFRANIDEMVEEGRGDQARAIQNLQTEFAGFNEEAGQGIADLISGTSAVGTAGHKLMTATGGAAMDIMNNLKAGKITQAQASLEMKQAMKKEQERTRQTASQIDAATAGTLEQSAISDIVASMDSSAADRAKTAQKKQLKGADPLTESTISAQQHMENLNMELQKLGFEVLPYAADAVDAVTTTVNKAVDFIMERIRGGPVSTEPYYDQGAGDVGAAIMAAAEPKKATTKAPAPTTAPTAPTPTAKAPTTAPAAPAPTPTAKAPTTAPAAPTPTAKAPAPTAAPTAPAPTTRATAPTAEPSAKVETAPATREQTKYAEKPGEQKGVVGAIVSGLDAIKQMIIRHEGIRTKPYKDSLGLWTVGVGHLIGDGRSLPPEMNREFSQQEIMTMFEQDFAKHYAIAQKTPGWDKASETAKGAMIDLAFNMGQWWNKFPNTAKALASGDWKAAADGLRDSNWYTQVKSRAATVVGMIEQGGESKEKKSTAASGAILSGPAQGYNPNNSMTGIDVKPLNKQAVATASAAGGQTDIDPQLFGAQMEQLDLLIANARNQLTVKQRILKAKA